MISADVWNAAEAILRQDPARRGLTGYRRNGRPLAPPALAAAAQSLAVARRAVLITGFAIPTAAGWRPETDGPPGTLFLADALQAAGIEVTLVSDPIARDVLHAGCDALGWPRALVRTMPLASDAPTSDADAAPERSSSGTDASASEVWADDFLAQERACGLTHLVAIERCGPSHTLQSLSQQRRTGAPPVEQFLADVPAEHQDRCHNMRGESIEPWTARTHRLLELGLEARDVTTIGVADGGNELGMGAVPWEEVVAALGTSQAGRIVCRVPSDHLLLAGVSNWGGYALGLAVRKLCPRSTGRAWEPIQLSALIEKLVAAGAVDGVTRQPTCSVDGLEISRYLPVYEALRQALA